MAESLNFSVGTMGSESRTKISKNMKDVSLDEALAAVQKLPVSKEQKKILSEMAKKVPSGSLGNFLSNYSNHLKKHQS